MRNLHQTEVVNGGFHACGVGIVGIDNEVILRRHSHLRAVVMWRVVGKCAVDVVERHVVDVADGNGGEHVVKVIGADEFRLYLHPRTGVTRVGVLLAPAETKERRT